MSGQPEPQKFETFLISLAMRAPKPLSPFICGSTLSIADFALACLYRTVKTHEDYAEIEPLVGQYH